jgi:hypothetical protein
MTQHSVISNWSTGDQQVQVIALQLQRLVIARCSVPCTLGHILAHIRSEAETQVIVTRQDIKHYK